MTQPLPPRAPSALRTAFRPSLLLGLWLLIKAFFDAAVLLSARHGLLPLPDLTPFLLVWSAVEIVGALLAALGLLERARWGWWGAVGLTFFLLTTGTASLWVDPPQDWRLVGGVAYAYHALILATLHGRPLRGELLGEGSRPLPWLGAAWGVLLGIGLGLLGIRYAGIKGAALPAAWVVWSALREVRRRFGPR